MLHNGNLSTKHPWKTFQDIEWIIDSEGTNTINLANAIAKYRKEMIDVLKSNEATEKHDEDVLKSLIDKLETKKALLETDLWRTPSHKIDLTDNTDIVNFWKSIIDGSNPNLTWESADPDDITDINGRIQEALNGIQFLHYFLEDDWTTLNQKDHWKLLKGASTEMTNIKKTLTNPLISTVLNETDVTKVHKDIDNFVKSVKRTKWNAFYIQSGKLYTDEQRETAIRIALYLYCIYKIANDPSKITKELCNDMNEKLDQIIKEEIPKIKWLHNTKVELGYLVPEYETLKDLNTKLWNVNLWEIDLWSWTTEQEIIFKDDFENWTAVDLDKYTIKSSEFEVKDSTGNPIPVIFSDWMLDFTDLSANKGIRLSSEILLDIWWSRLKIWKIFIDNNSLHQINIKFDDEATIKAIATAKWITLPSFPLDISFNLKWTKKVSNGLDGCYASLTKKYATKLKLWSIVPPTPTPTPTPRPTPTPTPTPRPTPTPTPTPRPTPTPTPTPRPTPTLKEQREWAMTISNVDRVNRAIAEREADEELRERKGKTGINLLDKANLFLRRKFIKDKIVRKKIRWKEWFDWSDSGQSAAHRHQIEEQENLSDNLDVLVDIDEVNYPETRRRIDTLIDNFTWRLSTPPRRWGTINEDTFKDEFEKILNQSGTDFDETDPTWTNPDWKKINEIITSNNLRSLSTNLIMQAKQFQSHQKMVYNIWDHIRNNPTEWDDVFDTWCRWEIESYIDAYDDIPDFLSQMWLSIDNIDDIKTLKANDAALATIQAQSLKYRLQILDGGDEAYNVKKDKWWFLTKVWRRLDDPTENKKFGKRLEKHPNIKEAFGWIRWVGKIATIPATMFIFAPTWPLATALLIGGLSGLTTFVNKKSHYEKEYRSYQRMQATNLTEYRNNRANLANEVAWMKLYEGRFWWKKSRNRQQFKDYILTTQDQLLSTNELVTNIKTYLKKGNILTTTEKEDLGKLLADWLARLDYHKETGQNFLWSDSPDVAEKEYKQLQNAIIWWTLRLNINTDDLRTKTPYETFYDDVKDTIMNWTNRWTSAENKYDTQWYLKAKKRFKHRSNTKAWYWALKAWAISFALSYLASSCASWTETTTTTTETSETIHNWNIWWEYNLWDWQEHLFVSWDVNPTMNSVINNSTTEITWGTLYSSVDAAYCNADFWAQQLIQAQADLTEALWNSTITWNANLVDAINNYVADATTKIWQISWLSAGNHDLAIARAIEAAKEGILEPIIASNNTTISIDPTCLTRTDPWTIQTTWGAIGETFRNMWIMDIDIIQKWTEEIVNHTTRVIPIALPSRWNTFWEPRSKVA